MIDKSIRADYAIQGKVKNYLGKQKMVKAPKKWKSAPNHPETELAYITKAEKDALVKMNLHGSMNGKAHKGPSGIISLNGWGDASHGFGGSGNTGGGGGGGGGNPHRDPPPAPAPARVSPIQSMAMTGNTSLAGKTQSEAQASVDRDNASRDLGTSLHGGPTVKEALRIGDLKKSATDFEKEKMDFIGGEWVGGDKITPETTSEKVKKLENTDERFWTIEDKRLMEKYESEQDWDKVKELADKGHSSDDIQKAMDKGLLMKQDAMRRQGLVERGLAAIKPTTKLESSLIDTVKKTFDPKSIAKTMAKNVAMKKLGLSWLNPILGIASLFGLPQKAKSMYAARKAPAFDPKEASKLGLYADRFPTGTTQYAKARDRKTTPEKIVSGEVDLAKLISGDNRTLVAGLKDMSTKQIVEFKKLDMLDKMNKSGVGEPLSDEDKEKLEKLRKLKDSKVTGSTGTVVAAYGGRIDKPLTGRSRDI